MKEDDIADIYQQLHDYEMDIVEYNDSLLKWVLHHKQINAFWNSLEDLRITDKITIVNKPTGDMQNEDAPPPFSGCYVDQWSTGIEGDSFAGFIYYKMIDGLWLKIPYDC